MSATDTNGAKPVQIPGDAVSNQPDISGPTTAILQQLSLLPTPGDAAKASGIRGAFAGAPDSVAVIEAGATAATKWWATGIGASVIATWAKVFTWWGTQHDGIKAVVGGGAFLLTAAAALGIAYLFASDVRGRAAASVATINARADIAQAMIKAAEDVHGGGKAARGSSAVGGGQLIPLPAGLYARNIAKRADAEEGWRAVAVQPQDDGSCKYLLVNGPKEELVDAGDVEFGPLPKQLMEVWLES